MRHLAIHVVLHSNSRTTAEIRIFNKQSEVMPTSRNCRSWGKEAKKPARIRQANPRLVGRVCPKRAYLLM